MLVISVRTRNRYNPRRFTLLWISISKWYKWQLMPITNVTERGFWGVMSHWLALRVNYRNKCTFWVSACASKSQVASKTTLDYIGNVRDDVNIVHTPEFWLIGQFWQSQLDDVRLYSSKFFSMHMLWFETLPKIMFTKPILSSHFLRDISSCE